MVNWRRVVTLKFFKKTTQLSCKRWGPSIASRWGALMMPPGHWAWEKLWHAVEEVWLIAQDMNLISLWQLVAFGPGETWWGKKRDGLCVHYAGVVPADLIPIHYIRGGGEALHTTDNEIRKANGTVHTLSKHLCNHRYRKSLQQSNAMFQFLE